MGSNGKKKTTFAKLNREQKVRDRRIEKQARKDARKLAPDRGQWARRYCSQVTFLTLGPLSGPLSARPSRPW